jgi:anti-sigma regulatory factor (Ser/Thr protein kinase)
VVHELSFDLANDIALALAGGTAFAADLRVNACDFGPLAELHHAGIVLGHHTWLNIGRHAELMRAMTAGKKWFSASGMQGFVTMSEILSQYSDWTDFAMRGKKAAIAAGFAPDMAGQLFGAIGELRGNIEEHSENAGSGYIAYDATSGHFEFVVADSGIGILKSLRTHQHYAYVKDAGTALNLALTEGVSRHYDDEGRGKGFRPIFIGLANASEHVRFCSGDHTRELKRTHERRVTAETRQKAVLSGFFCSVRCAT